MPTTQTTEPVPVRAQQPRAPRSARERRRENLLLRRYCITRDPSLREELVRTYLPLARTIARRYQSPRVPLEDLVQVAAIGLMKAIDRYDPDRGIAFSSYAVPTMMGEVQRHFRDHTWGVRPPRELQERAQRILTANRVMGAELGHPPSAGELSTRLQLSLEQVVDALQACEARDATSLDRPRTVGRTTRRSRTRWAWRIPATSAWTGVTAERLMEQLDDREREILRLRFHDDLTQSEIGERVGCSQMHVSRLVRGALAKLSADAGV